MTDPPPPYSSVVDADAYNRLPAEIKAQIKTLDSLPLATKAAAATAVHQELAKSSTAQDILDSVNKLGDSAVVTNELFEKVRLGLADVDSRDYEDGKGNRLPKYEPTWKGYQEAWTRIFLESRDTASKTVAYIGEFLRDVLPEVKDAKTAEGVKEAQETLAEFAEKKNPSKERAAIHSDEFAKLKTSLQEFKDKFDNDTKKLQDSLKAEIKNKNAEITNLSDEIAQCESAILYTAITLGVIVLATGVTVGIGIAFSLLASEIIAAILIAGIVAAAAKVDSLVSEIRKLNGLKTRQDGLKREVEELTRQLKEVQRVQTNLNNQKDTIVGIAARIDQFANIWSSIAAEATEVSTQLQDAHKNKHTVQEFKRRLNTLETNYKTLKEALFIYSTKTTAKST